MQQFVENAEDLFGKVSTVSLLLADGTLHTATGTLPTETVSANTGFWSPAVGGINVSAYKTAAGAAFAQIGNRSGSPVGLVAAKWELGDTQTLAHQDDDGRWVRNEAPRYADILRACQRYFVPIAQPTAMPARASSANSIQAILPIPVPMRTTPILSDTAGANWRVQDVAGVWITPSAVKLYAGGVQDAYVTLYAESAGLFTSGALYSVSRLSSAGGIALSAEL